MKITIDSNKQRKHCDMIMDVYLCLSIGLKFMLFVRLKLK